MPESTKTKSTDNAALEPSAEDIQKMFAHAILTGLVALVLLSLTFFYTTYKEKQELTEAVTELAPQGKSAQNFDHFYNNFIYDLSVFSQQHPEILQVLTQSGIDLQKQPQPQQAPQMSPGRQEIPPMPPPPPGQ